MRYRRGFTLAELVTVIAVVGILTAVALPAGRAVFRLNQESDLRDHLQKIAWAIDQYHELRLKGQIKEQAARDQGTYPKTLAELSKPIELVDGRKLVLLRPRDLVDPMTGTSTWNTFSSSDAYDSVSTNGDNIWDIHSTSTATALDGSHYNEW
ncbi:MAG TPA: prepilin-type N-terminal cleavage/methylation domain-containing protein [Thermoanaerobaculia bacterium]|nr:prepilin-type N-terminal cleavage/methylation domain-containing protein [Thermoanaerobaculia bacterium]